MELFRITKLEMENIGPFGRLAMDFPEKPTGMKEKAEIHILTGENGTGKTTILEALVSGISHNFYRTLNEKIRHSDFPNSFSVLFNRDRPFKISSSSPIDGSFKVESVNTFVENILSKKWSEVRPVAFFAYSGYRRIEHVKIDGIREITEDPLSKSLDFQHSVNYELMFRWISNTLAKEALAKSEPDQTAANKFRFAINSIENTLSNIVDKNIHFSLSYDPLSVHFVLDGIKHNFNALPDGLKSMISWIGDLLMRMDRIPWENNTPVFERNFILFLDEIEVHMHPAWQRKILPAIQGLFPNAQIFISTHSPFVVGSVDGAWIHKLVKPNGDSHLAKEYPMVSEDAKSYQYWLDEVFGIREQFGPEVEHDIKHFYTLRDAFLRGVNGQNSDKLIEIGRALARQSAEVN
ncbi:MAG: AAA family ATPase [Saprospiraceae bacterium]